MLTDDQVREIWNRAIVNSDERRTTFAPVLRFARAILAAERDAAIEECAMVCDRRAQDYHMSGHTNRADATEIAASEIRALKGGSNGPII